MMQIKIDVNSWHCRLLGWTYGNHNIPKNLCPYFWLSIVTIGFFPLLLIGKGIVIIADLIAGMEISINYNSKYNKLIAYGLLALGGSVITWAVLAGYWREVIAILCIIGVVVGSVFGSLFLISLIQQRYTPKEKKPNLIIEAIKAKKNKYCPCIQFFDSKSYSSAPNGENSIT